MEFRTDRSTEAETHRGSMILEVGREFESLRYQLRDAEARMRRSVRVYTWNRRLLSAFRVALSGLSGAGCLSGVMGAEFQYQCANATAE